MNLYLHQILNIANNSKYTMWYMNICTKANHRANTRYDAVKLLKYCEGHHIIPKSFNLDGQKDLANILYLTAREHFLVHCILIKMFTGKFKQKMVFALNKLKISNKHQITRYFNSRLYEQLKKYKMKYIKVYKIDKIKYIIKDDIDEYNKYLNDGWSKIMTNEYKIGRVGNMKGRKHSNETKNRMSKSALGMKRRAKTDDEKLKQSMILKDRKKPDGFGKYISDVNKERHKLGILNSKGINNPIYGIKRKAIYNPITKEQKYLNITNSTIELNDLLANGWILGLIRKLNRI